MKTTSRSVKSQYDVTLQNFKKKLHDSETDKSELNDDVAIFIEQKHIPFDPLLLQVQNNHHIH
jgi:hypothetical protein